MFTSTLRQRLLSATLLAALLLQLLLPALAGATAGSSERWVEVCAASGAKWIRLDGAGVSPHAATDHCALCAATGALPEFDARAFIGTPAVDARPAWPAAPVFPAYPGHALRARAPPSLS